MLVEVVYGLFAVPDALAFIQDSYVFQQTVSCFEPKMIKRE